MGDNQAPAPQTVCELPQYIRKAEKLLTEDEREELLLLVASNPEVGDLLVGTGGIRKVRFSRGGQGKSGGVRLVYFFYNQGMPIFFLTLFAKNERANLNQAERNSLRKLTRLLVQEYTGEPDE